MNAFKKNGGFTLVELIIVIAILAILSSVAVAGYSTYITKANEAARNAWENDIETAATLASAKFGTVTVTFVNGSDNTVFVIVKGAVSDAEFETDFERSVTGLDGKVYKTGDTLPTGATGAAIGDYVGTITYSK